MTSIISQTSHFKPTTIFQQIYSQLNFYRLHLLFFTFTPLVVSGIFYASNGRYMISYIDCLFNCVSAMTVCGLATINLSSLTGFQQALLFSLMCIGNPVIVSWFIVYMRRHFFAKKFEGVLEASTAKKVEKTLDSASKQHRPWPHRFIAYVSGRQLSVEDEEQLEEEAKKGNPGAIRKLRPDMIRRMDDAPKLVNPSGWVSEGRAPSMRKNSISSTAARLKASVANALANPGGESSSSDNNPRSVDVVIDFVEPISPRARRLSDPGRPSRPNSPTSGGTKMHRFETVGNPAPKQPSTSKRFPRTQTVEFATPPRRPDRIGLPFPEHGTLYEEGHNHLFSPQSAGRRSFYQAPSMTHTTGHTTGQSGLTHHHFRPETSLYTNFGGFPSIFSILKSLFKRLFPSVQQTLTRTVTIPATVSLVPDHGKKDTSEKKNVPYISFEATVGRNSAFHMLTRDQLDEIGGVEYRALNALMWIVPLYHFGIQLTAFAVIAPYVSAKRWDSVFQEQIRPLNIVWFSAFQVVSAYTNTGTSLVDESMLPFQSAYPMIIFMIILILAGNTSFPIFLRFMIWCISKIISKKSRMHETLRFLLDHPRRCFIYLFPSHQTWFLLTVVLGLTFTDWFFFLVLDLHDSAIKAIPVGIRVLDGLFQAAAVRAAGFAIVPLSAIAPAVKVLYVVMMYISVYPIAMSVRSTNVYEEQSLGVFNPNDPELEDEQSFEASGPRMNVWSRYLAMHARKQLAFDMWWLALSLFVICIIEKDNILNPEQFEWFTIFQIIFELVSAYGTVGLSLGIPDQNYSFVGAMHTLSKLIICLVMLRGRHRGLPVAIDRAVMLPSEFNNKKEDDNADQDASAHGRPFVYSETMGSRFTSNDLRHRPHRSSRMWDEDDDNGAGRNLSGDETARASKADHEEV